MNKQRYNIKWNYVLPPNTGWVQNDNGDFVLVTTCTEVRNRPEDIDSTELPNEA